MTEIISDVVVSLFAVMGLIFLLNELSALFGKNALGGASVYIICPDGCTIDSEYILNLTKTVPADKYIIVPKFSHLRLHLAIRHLCRVRGAMP